MFFTVLYEYRPVSRISIHLPFMRSLYGSAENEKLLTFIMTDKRARTHTHTHKLNDRTDRSTERQAITRLRKDKDIAILLCIKR
jgi:hypothetical protein